MSLSPLVFKEIKENFEPINHNTLECCNEPEQG